MSFKYEFMLKQLGLKALIKNKRVESIFDASTYDYLGFYLRFENELENNEEQLIKIRVDNQREGYKWIEEVYKTVSDSISEEFKIYLTKLAEIKIIHNGDEPEENHKPYYNFHFYGSFGIEYDKFEEKNVVKNTLDDFYLDLKEFKNNSKFQETFGFKPSDWMAYWEKVNVSVKFSAETNRPIGLYYSTVCPTSKMKRMLTDLTFLQENIDIVKFEQALDVLTVQTKNEFQVEPDFNCLFAFQKKIDTENEKTPFKKFIYSPIILEYNLVK